MFLKRLKFQRKLMFIFTGMALLPTIVLVLVAYHLISQSIERWANSQIALTLQNSAIIARDARTLAYELSLRHYLPLIDAAEILAVDFQLITALQDESVTAIEDRVAEFPDAYGEYVIAISEYIIAIYDRLGHRIFSTDKDLPPMELTRFSPGLEQLTDEPTIFPDLEIQGLLGCGMPVFSEDNPEQRLGWVVLGKSMLLTPFQMREQWNKIQGKLDALETDMDEAGTEYRRTEKRNTFIALLITAVSIVALSFWVSRVFARGINTPIQTLVASTKQIADGNLNHRVDVQTDDEFSILADAFNRMVADLSNRTEELKRAEKIAAWQDIAQKLAHEIKNPLTPIQLSAQRLRRRYHKDPDDFADLLERCTQTIITEVGGLRHLLDEFSQLARMPVPQLTSVNLRETVDAALDILGEFPPHIDCRVEVPSDLPHVIGDAEYLKRAFLNLIKNAQEAMSVGSGGKPLHQQGILIIRAFQSADSSKVLVQFSDTGHGIAPDVRPKLFAPHVSTKKDGTGLGLAIVKKILTDLGGDIHLEADEPDKIGATFTLWLKSTELPTR